MDDTPEARDGALDHWFLDAAERGNPHTVIDRDRGDGRAWTEGNAVRALVHGGEYFPRLLEVLTATGDGDLVLFTDWRGDGDERLGDAEGTELATVLVGVLRRGGDVRGLVWRSHPDQARFSEQEAVALAEAVNGAGGEVLLDERVRRAGLAPPEAGAGAAPRPRGRRRRLRRAASTCATGATTTSGTSATPRPSCWTPATARRRPGTTRSWRSGGPRSATWR